MAILVNGGILSSGGVASGRVCSLRSRLIHIHMSARSKVDVSKIIIKKNMLFEFLQENIISCVFLLHGRVTHLPLHLRLIFLISDFKERKHAKRTF